MIKLLRRRLDWFFGRGAAAVTVPSMDGALRPNTLLENAGLVSTVREPDNLTWAGGTLLYSSGEVVRSLDLQAGRSEVFRRFPHVVTSLAWSDEALAVAVPGELRIVGGAFDGQSFSQLGEFSALCPTALAFEGPCALLVCLGSQTNPPGEWKRDLLQRNASGAVCRIDLKTKSVEVLARDLAYPYGIAPHGEEIWVSESWRHRVIGLRRGAATRNVFEHLPAYPSRLSAAPGGGVWLAMFAPRRQMVEFVLSERAYCERMMAEVEPEYWMAPALSTGKSFLEPIHGGQVKHLGIVKPWGPTRSYGLVVRLDASGIPTASLHSRADGKRHGVTSCLEKEGRLIIASKGGGALLEVDVASLEME